VKSLKLRSLVAVAAVAAFVLPQAAIAVGGHYCKPEITEIVVNEDVPQLEIYGKCFPDKPLEVMLAEGQQGEFASLDTTWISQICF